jgi:hypothetical protein
MNTIGLSRFRLAGPALRRAHAAPESGFALVAIASLALGIGANTAIFQLIDAVNLRTLPVARAQELAEVRITDASPARGSMNRYPALTNPQWERMR